MVLTGSSSDTTDQRHLSSVVSPPDCIDQERLDDCRLERCTQEGRNIDLPTWRFIQRLGDLRSLSVHSKERVNPSRGDTAHSSLSLSENTGAKAQSGGMAAALLCTR